MRTGVFVDGAGRDPEQMIAQLAELADRGVGQAWLNEHAGVGWDPLTVLAAAGTTGAPGLALGTAVVPTYPKHPVALAAQALTVQAVTGGRLSLGIGPSHASVINGQLGIPYTAPAAHTREYLQILRPLLRGEQVDYRGEQLSASTRLEISAPPPQVLIAATGPVMVRTAGELADGLIANFVRPALVHDYLVPRITAAADGAPRRVVVVALVAVTDDADTERESVATTLGAAAELPAYQAVLARGGLSGPAEALVAGDERAVTAELARFADAGATDLVVLPWGSPETAARTIDLVAGLA